MTVSRSIPPGSRPLAAKVDIVGVLPEGDLDPAPVSPPHQKFVAAQQRARGHEQRGPVLRRRGRERAPQRIVGQRRDRERHVAREAEKAGAEALGDARMRAFDDQVGPAAGGVLQFVQPERRVEGCEGVRAPVVDEGGLEPAAAFVDSLDDGAADIAVADHPDARRPHVTASRESVRKSRHAPPDITDSTAATASQMSTWRM